MTSRSSSHKTQRFVALDSLRGISALAVVWFHFYCFSSLPGALNLPAFADWLLRHAYLGVEVFFVLSGFVIAYSVSDQQITGRYVYGFVVRRSLRLDPPYWTALILATAILALASRPPSLPSIAAHFLYLQNIFGFTNIVSQFWTLCYEVQFYLVFILLVFLGQRVGRKFGFALQALLFLASLALLVKRVDPHGWFVGWWYAFALGVATVSMLERRVRKLTWILMCTFSLGTAIWIQDIRVAAVVVAALSIGCAGLLQKLTVWSGGPFLTWLGRISYSLYLTHFLAVAGVKFASAKVHTPVTSALVFLAGTLLALATAGVFNRCIEMPALALSKQIGARISSGQPWFKKAENLTPESVY